MGKPPQPANLAAEALLAGALRAVGAAIEGKPGREAWLETLRAAARRHPIETARLIGLEAARCPRCEGRGEIGDGRPCRDCGGEIVGTEIRQGSGAVIRASGG